LYKNSKTLSFFKTEKKCQTNVLKHYQQIGQITTLNGRFSHYKNKIYLFVISSVSLSQKTFIFDAKLFFTTH